MKAVFVCDNNKVYSDFWEPMAKHMYRAFGLESTLYYLTDEMTHSLFTSEYATVITIPLIKDIPQIIQALLAKWYFPAIQPSSEHVFICDIDCFLLSKQFIEYVRDSDTLFHLKLYVDDTHLPGYYVYGTPEQLKEFFQLGIMTFEEFCRHVMNSKYLANLQENEANQFSKNASSDWKYFCTEERYAAACAHAYTKPKRDTVDHPQPGRNRICRSHKSSYNTEHLLNNLYIDYHSPRPYSEYKSTIHEIIDSI
jgi:hypothetical protein